MYDNMYWNFQHLLLIIKLHARILFLFKCLILNGFPNSEVWFYFVLELIFFLKKQFSNFLRKMEIERAFSTQKCVLMAAFHEGLTWTPKHSCSNQFTNMTVKEAVRTLMSSQSKALFLKGDQVLGKGRRVHANQKINKEAPTFWTW